MRIPYEAFEGRLPLPPAERWPDGVWDIEAFARGSMSVILFAPRGADHQLPHAQDELYVVLAGHGTLEVDGTRVPFVARDVLFVPARAVHRFVEFSEDFATWAIFWGLDGGEGAAIDAGADPMTEFAAGPGSG